MAELRIESRSVEGVPEVWLQGELDSDSAPRVRLFLEALLDGPQPLVRLRLSALEYIDSMGLGVLVGALKRTNDKAGTLVLVEPSAQVAHALQITGLDKVFTILAGPPVTPLSSPAASA